MQAVAGYFVHHGHRRAAITIRAAHHCILRTGEMLNVRTTDITFAGKLCQIRLRDTKVGQRLDITEETDIVDPWLRRVFKKAFRSIYPGDTIAGMSPAAFRRVWSSAIRAVGLPSSTNRTG